jgi:hypothetical protein
LSVAELKIAQDLLNCPVEGLKLIEEQPTESIDEGVSQQQFYEDLKLFKIEGHSIKVDPQLITENTSKKIFIRVQVESATLFTPKTILLSVETLYIDFA